MTQTRMFNCVNKEVVALLRERYVVSMVNRTEDYTNKEWVPVSVISDGGCATPYVNRLQQDCS